MRGQTYLQLSSGHQPIEIKGALDNFSLNPHFFQKKNRDFYTIRSDDMGNDCMLSFMF